MKEEEIMNETSKKRLGIFLLLTFALSSIFYVLVIRAGTMNAAGGLYIAGLMWMPGVAALATQLITRGTVRGLGWGWGKTRYQLLSIALPFLAALAIYGVVWLSGLGGFPDPAFVATITDRAGIDAPQPVVILVYLLISTVIGLAAGSLTALGEEIGWRGFLAPELRQVTSFTKTSLLSGVIWVVWHAPIILFADYNGEAPVWYALGCFGLMAIAFSFVMAWIRLKSGSVWTAMFLHASHNLFIQGIFDPFTMDTGPTEYLIGEFGIGMAIVYAAVAFFLWRRRAELPQVEREEDGSRRRKKASLVT